MRVEEFNEILLSDNVRTNIIDSFDEIVKLIPELLPMKDFNQNNRYHIYDVLTHTLEVVMNTEKDLVLRLSALFHDIGKPHTYTIDQKGNGHFYGHGDKSVILTQNVLKRLGYQNNIIGDVLSLIKYHDYPLYPEVKPLTKFLKKIDNCLLDKLFQLKRADILGQSPTYKSRLTVLDEAKTIIKSIK